MKYNVITIEREFASGGSEIAKILADKLNFRLCDSEILNLAAREIGSTVDNVGHMDEKVHTNIFYSMYAMSVSDRAFDISNVLPIENSLQMEEEKIIKKFADCENCVIVGRCAGSVLRDRSNVLRVFITADAEIRRERAINNYGIDSKNVDKIIKFHDKSRAMYYKLYSDKAWVDKKEYHMVLNSGKLGTENCADIIISALQ